MRLAKLKEHLKLEGLRQRMVSSKDRGQFQRWQALYLTRKGLNSETIAEYVGISSGTVHQWIYQYNHLGPEGMTLRGRGGRRHGLMSLEEEEAFLEELREEAERGELIAAFAIREKVEGQVGKKVSKDYLYDMFHRHGWRKVEPRPRNPKTDVQVQAEFKKNFPSMWQPPPPVSLRKTSGR